MRNTFPKAAKNTAVADCVRDGGEVEAVSPVVGRAEDDFPPALACPETRTFSRLRFGRRIALMAVGVISSRMRVSSQKSGKTHAQAHIYAHIPAECAVTS